MKENQHNTPITIQESEIKGEKIIFDIAIKGKLAHVIVIKDGYDYHINLDGEDLGHLSKDLDGKIERFSQPKGANTDTDDYFEAVEQKLNELHK